MMTPDQIEAHFTHSNGDFLCARWGRPIVPVVFGVEDATLSTIKGAIELVVGFSGHKMAETDPEFGANLMFFFCRDWSDLVDVPNLDRLVPELRQVVERLSGADANQYRIFRFDRDGAICACFVFLRMDAEMSKLPAETIALGQAVQILALWSESAFAATSPLALANGVAVLRPEIGALLKAVYDPILPAGAKDKVHALRLFARMSKETLS